VVEQEENSILDEDDESPQFDDVDIDEAAHAKLQKFQRIQAGRLIPKELLISLIAGLIVLISVVSWTVYSNTGDINSDFEDCGLWTMSFYPQPQGTKDFEQQEKSLKAAIQASAKAGGQTHANQMALLGSLYMRNGMWQQALDLLSGWKTAHTDQTSSSTAMAFYDLGLTQYQLGDEVHAETSFRDCLATARKAGVTEYESTLPACQGLVAIYTKMGDLPTAQEAADRILEIYAKRPANDPATGDKSFWLCQSADINRRMKNYKQAEEQFKRALSGGLRGEQSNDTARALFGLGLVLLKEHKFQDAEKSLKQAHMLAQATMGPTEPILLAIREQYAQCLWKTNWIAALALKFSAADKAQNQDKQQQQQPSAQPQPQH